MVFPCRSSPFPFLTRDLGGGPRGALGDPRGSAGLLRRSKDGGFNRLCVLQGVLSELHFSVSESWGSLGMLFLYFHCVVIVFLYRL